MTDNIVKADGNCTDIEKGTKVQSAPVSRIP